MKIISLCVMLCGSCAFGQIVNTGVAYLSPKAVCAVVDSFRNTSTGRFINDGTMLFYNNFSNAGTFDYYADTGKISFVGNHIQYLSGENTYFNTLVFNNLTTPLAFQMNGVFETDSVYFYQGIVSTIPEESLFYITPEGAALGASNQSFVTGRLTKIGQTDFGFPIGDQRVYRPAVIYGMTQSNSIRSQYVYQMVDVIYPLSQKAPEIRGVDGVEFWEITSEQTWKTPLFIALTYDDSTTPRAFLDAAQDETLVVLHWNSENAQWENLGGTVDLAHHRVLATASHPGIFTLGRITSTSTCPIEVFNLIELGQQNQNTHLRFVSECAEIERVVIFNRWGRPVFAAQHYGKNGEVFSGYANQKVAFDQQQHLPKGTYFYVLHYTAQEAEKRVSKQKVGYLYLR